MSYWPHFGHGDNFFAYVESSFSKHPLPQYMKSSKKQDHILIYGLNKHWFEFLRTDLINAAGGYKNIQGFGLELPIKNWKRFDKAIIFEQAIYLPPKEGEKGSFGALVGRYRTEYSRRGIRLACTLDPRFRGADYLVSSASSDWNEPFASTLINGFEKWVSSGVDRYATMNVLVGRYDRMINPLFKDWTRIYADVPRELEENLERMIKFFEGNVPEKHHRSDGIRQNGIIRNRNIIQVPDSSSEGE